MRFAIALVVAASATVALRYPMQLAFPAFAFGDPGLELVAQSQSLAGETPGENLGWIYGLLPLAVGKIWYGVFGVSPQSFASAAVLCQALVLWGVARFVESARVPRPGQILLVSSCPFWLPNGGMTLVQEIEPVLIVWAVVSRVENKFPKCIVLLTLCVFVKPSMAYVFGGLVCAELAGRVWADGPKRANLLPFACAGVVATALGLGLSCLFGVNALADSLYPSAAAKIYAQSNFGFFRSGMEFWAPSPFMIRHYLTRSVAGVWLLASGFVLVSAVVSATRSASVKTTNDRTLVYLALLHFAFVFLFFGNSHSYRYYFYLLIMALSLCSAIWTRHRWVVVILSIWFGMFLLRQVNVSRVQWQLRTASPLTAGLYAEEGYRDNWRRILDKTAPGRTALLSASEGATLLTDHFGPPVLTFADVGWMTPELTLRKRRQLAEADFIVVPVEFMSLSDNPDRSPFGDELRCFELDFETQYFKVFRNRKLGAP